MKKLLNFFSKRGNTTEVKTTITTPKVVLEPETIKKSVPQPKREAKKWDGIQKVKYVYGAEELSELLTSTILASFNLIVNKRGVYFIREEKHFNDDVFSTKNSGICNSSIGDYKTKYTEKTLSSYGLDKEKYKAAITNLSKKDKKRINNLIFKLNISPDNSYRFIKLLNTLESKIGNKNHYSLGNKIEEDIAIKRKIYKDIVKHIKMDLPAELKKAKAEFKTAKGDFYKTKK